MSHLIATLARAGKGAALVLHGAGGIRSGLAYLFLGQSGGGKSTLARLCDNMGVSVLGDDSVLVLEKGANFHVRPLPRQAPVLPASHPVGDETRLRGVFFLAKAPNPIAEPISPLKAVARCLKESLIFEFDNMASAERLAVLDRCMRLFRRVPAYVLHFAKDNRFWDVIDALDQRETALSTQ